MLELVPRFAEVALASLRHPERSDLADLTRCVHVCDDEPPARSKVIELLLSRQAYAHVMPAECFVSLIQYYSAQLLSSVTGKGWNRCRTAASPAAEHCALQTTASH